MKKTKKKASPKKKNPFANLIILAGILLACIIGYFVYSLPVFWAKPATVELAPEEGKGVYLGMSPLEFKAVKSKLALYKEGKVFKNEIYYDRKIKGNHFDNAYYSFNFYGKLADLGFSRHLKADKLEKAKYEYINYYTSKYGADYKKAIWVYKPFLDKRFIYQMFIWEKAEARIVLQFSFYDNDKDGYLCRNNGVYLSINYPKVTNETRLNKIIMDQENPELKETFKLHFPELDKKAGDLKKVSEPVTSEKKK